MIQAQYTCSSTAGDTVEDTYLVYRGSEECLGTLRCVRKLEPMETLASDSDITVALHITTPKRMKSRYWKYFGFWADENGTIFDNRKVVCRLCNQIQTYHGNTTNLRNHLKIHHKLELAGIEGNNAAICWEGTQTPSPNNQNVIVSLPNSQSISNSSPPKCITYPSHQMTDTPDENDHQDSKVWNSKNKLANIACLLCDDLLPVKTVEGHGFQNFIQALKPGCRLPDQEAVKEDIRKLYNTSYNELCETLSNIDSVSLAIENWTTKESFFTITVHYLNSDWEAEHRVLQTFMYKEWQTPTNIAGEILQCMEVFQLSNKVVSVTTNGSDFLTNAVEEYLNLPTIQCLAHLVNHCVLHVLSSCTVLQGIFGKLKALAEYFASSSADAELLEKKQALLDLPHDELLSYSDTSWKTLYEMLARAVEQHTAVASVVLERKLEHLELSTNEWTIVQQVVELLKAANATTVALLAQDYPCASTVLPLFRLLLDSFGREKDDELQLVKELRQELYSEFKDKYQNPEVRDLLNIASFCDPRFKELLHLSDDEKQAVKERVKSRILSAVEEERGAEEAEAGDGPPAKRPRGDMSVMEDLFATFFEPSQRSSKSTDSLKTLEEKSEQELKNYLAEDRLSLASDPLEYWKCAEHRFPLLGGIAKKMMCMTGTSVPSVRIFDDEHDEVASKRSQIEHDVLDSVLFMHDHIRKKDQQ